MQSLRRSFLVLAAASSAATGLAACGGNSIPGDSVVRVGDASIKKDTFNHWLNVVALTSAAQTDPAAAQKGVKPKVTIPQPPDFAACVANKAKTAPKPAKGQPTPTTAQFKTQCKQEYEGLRDQVLQFLISAQWFEQEGADQGIKVTDAEVKTQFDKIKKQSFPKDADFQKFLVSSGQQESDLMYRVKIDTLTNKLRTKITKGKDKVAPAQIAAYYNKNKARFAQPEKRDLRIVLTKATAAGKAQAEKALAALKGGQSFKAVAKKYSIDQASKAQGGVLSAVAKGQQEKALDAAVFAAKKGQLVGPVKTQFGYYVFKVQKITPASQQTLVQATPTIKQLLASQNQQKALDAFVKTFQKKWKDKTNCSSNYVVQVCKNAPKPKTSTTAAPAGQGTPTPVPQTSTGG